MVKRLLETEDLPEPPAKRIRADSASTDRLSNLSDELILRIFSYLSPAELNRCQRLSTKYFPIAIDPQLWKGLYYMRFVKPRAALIPGLSSGENPTQHLSYSSKLLKYLQPENAVWREYETNWKRQYKTQHNWARGVCHVREIQVAQERPIPPLLVKMHDGIIYTADAVAGLRAWSSSKGKRLQGTMSFKDHQLPISLTVDVSSESNEEHKLVLGFKDGSFAIISFSRSTGIFTTIYKHKPKLDSLLIGLAYCSPFLLTMNASQTLSIYKLSSDPNAQPPQLLHSLLSQSSRSPLSLSIRRTSNVVLATIAYAVPTMQHWSVGIQEMRLCHTTGDLLSSRIAISNPGLTPGTHNPFSTAAPAASAPTSLSYSHPYLLLSHPDNTLSLFLVTSTDAALSIGHGKRLWGHTSAVSGAHIEPRGKAVSVTKRGDELRVWRLEGAPMGKSGVTKRVLWSRWRGTIVRVVGKIEEDGSLEKSEDESGDEVTDDHDGLVRGWVGFDEETVVVLKERVLGRQDLVVYDFS